MFFTATGEEDGNPLVFRGRKNLKKRELPILVEVIWKYGPEMNPNEKTQANQKIFEDALEELDSETGDSVLALVVTGNGRKSWYWYTISFEYWLEKLNELLHGKPKFPIEIEYSAEPDWDLYYGFMDNLTE